MTWVCDGCGVTNKKLKVVESVGFELFSLNRTTIPLCRRLTASDRSGYGGSWHTDGAVD